MSEEADAALVAARAATAGRRVKAALMPGTKAAAIPS
jgi:hypothetical protein